MNALVYADSGMSIFPVSADKRPLVAHWREDASCDPAQIEAWRKRWPHCDYAWALPGSVVVADADESNGQHGIADLERLSGRPLSAIATAVARTPTGGAHILFATEGRSYVNRRIPSTSVDIKSSGGYVVLPEPDGSNGRSWLRPLLGATLLPAPAWLAPALRREPGPCSVHVRSPSDDPKARYAGRVALGQACARIVRAPNGEQDDTRNKETFYIGRLVKRGALTFEEAYDALLAAALAMPAHGDPWRELEKLVDRSLRAGLERGR
jgi:hypothetical protein